MTECGGTGAGGLCWCWCWLAAVPGAGACWGVLGRVPGAEVRGEERWLLEATLTTLLPPPPMLLLLLLLPLLPLGTHQDTPFPLAAITGEAESCAAGARRV